MQEDLVLQKHIICIFNKIILQAKAAQPMANTMTKKINGRVRHFAPVLTTKEFILIILMILSFITIGLIT